QKGRRQTGKGDKNSFFKQVTMQEEAQDGAEEESGDTHESPPNELPVTQGVLQRMLDTMHDRLQHTLQTALNEIKADIQDLGTRTLEDKMADQMEAYINLCTNMEEMHDNMLAFENKIAHIEDRSHCNNLRIRGIMETVGTADLHAHLHTSLHLIYPRTFPKPRFLMMDAPREVLMRLHYFHVKEVIMKASRQRPNLPSPYQGTAIYTDISAATLKKRKTFSLLTEQLRQHKKPYR
ncbi:Hypothetical predicted protein, partial [Pelobates cultripes]